MSNTPGCPRTPDLGALALAHRRVTYLGLRRSSISPAGLDATSARGSPQFLHGAEKRSLTHAVVFTVSFVSLHKCAAPGRNELLAAMAAVGLDTIATGSRGLGRPDLLGVARKRR